MSSTINFLLCGVGGQGTVLASDVLVSVGMAAGYQAKQAEVHGMSQRGGSVTSFVRWGIIVHSPLVGLGEVDILLAFEKLEALRNLNALRHDALAVINTQVVKPITVISGDKVYPDDDTLRAAFARVTPHVEFIDGEKVASELGNMRVANIVLLGALSAQLEQRDYSIPGLTTETWLKVITERVPAKHMELNRKAFQKGRDAVSGE